MGNPAYNLLMYSSKKQRYLTAATTNVTLSLVLIILTLQLSKLQILLLNSCNWAQVPKLCMENSIVLVMSIWPSEDPNFKFVLSNRQEVACRIPSYPVINEHKSSRSVQVILCSNFQNHHIPICPSLFPD